MVSNLKVLKGFSVTRKLLHSVSRRTPASKALAQCEHKLTSLQVVREPVDNTAGAAQLVALHKREDTAAVASISAARIYDLIEKSNLVIKELVKEND
ncbi:putative hydro-lyase [Helianthus annuus]|nr:putative hydro-lyase [Helianthus annuus]